MQDEADEEIDLTELELFDISDIKIDIQRTKNSTKLYLILKSESPINLMRFYLSIKGYVEKIENELGVMPEEPEVH